MALTAFVFILLLLTMAQVNLAKGNFYPYGLLQIDVRSPHSTPYIYVEPNADISFDYHVPNTQVTSFTYSLDGNENSTLTIVKISNIYYYNALNHTVFETLENLSNGNHRIIVYAHFSNNTVSQIFSTTITVDTTFTPPIPFLISPLNKTAYNTKQVPLIYTTNSKILWSYYSLDDSDWKPFTGNITLPNLSEGQHKIKLIVTTESRQTTTYTDSAQTIIFKANPSITNPISIEPIPNLVPTFTPTQTPTVPELSWLTLFPLFFSILFFAVLFRKRKRSDNYD